MRKPRPSWSWKILEIFLITTGDFNSFLIRLQSIVWFTSAALPNFKFRILKNKIFLCTGAEQWTFNKVPTHVVLTLTDTFCMWSFVILAGGTHYETLGSLLEKLNLILGVFQCIDNWIPWNNSFSIKSGEV